MSRGIVLEAEKNLFNAMMRDGKHACEQRKAMILQFEQSDSWAAHLYRQCKPLLGIGVPLVTEGTVCLDEEGSFRYDCLKIGVWKFRKCHLLSSILHDLRFSASLTQYTTSEREEPKKRTFTSTSSTHGVASSQVELSQVEYLEKYNLLRRFGYALVQKTSESWWHREC